MKYQDYKPLSRDEQRELCERRDAGDESAAWELAESVFPMAMSLAARFAKSRDWDIDEAYSSACLGAHHAAKKLDPDVASITTYAHPWIRQYMLRDHPRMTGSVVWVPHSADASGHGEKADAARSCASIHGGEGDGYCRELARDDEPSAQMERAETLSLSSKLVHATLLKMDKRRALVLRRRIFDGLKLREIGEEIGVSKARVQQIEKDAAKQFREIYTNLER